MAVFDVDSVLKCERLANLSGAVCGHSHGLGLGMKCREVTGKLLKSGARGRGISGAAF